MRIEELESVTSFDELLVAVGKSIADKSLHTWRLPQDFVILQERMVSLADADDALRLLATLGRLEAAAKKSLFNPHTVMPMLQYPPDVQTMKEGDDRYYLALYVSQFDLPWLREWAIENSWSERSSEKARRVFVHVALLKSESMEKLLADLGGNIANVAKSQQMDEGKACARLLRTIKTLRQEFQLTECHFDLGVGEFIDSFIGAPFTHLTRSQTEVNARVGLVEEVVAFTLDFIAQRFSVAIEARHYLVLKRLSRWCSSDSWETLLNNSAVMDKLSGTLKEAVLILARQNIQDGNLLARLRDIQTDSSAFQRWCEDIANDAHIDQSVRNWLLAGGSELRPKKTISSEHEVADIGLSREIGDLLLAIQQGERSLDVLKGAVTDLELFDPELAPAVQDFINQWQLFSQSAGRIAKQSKVELVGTPGEDLDIDRKLFEVVNQGSISQRRGTLVRPAVVLLTNGKTRIIKKGVVRTQEG